MKKYILMLLFFLGGLHIQAQELKWYTDVQEAIAVSNKENKPMMLFFTGSDWCGWCIRLQNEVFSTSEFKNWASKNVVLVELDFPRRTPQSVELKNQNNQLQQVFGVQGFPTAYFVTAKTIDGKINFNGLGTIGYVAGGPKPWLENVSSFLKK